MLPCAHMDYLSGSEGWDCFTTMNAYSHCGCIIAKLLLHLTVKCSNILASVYQHTPSSVQFSCSVMSDSLWPHGLQHTRPPCPSPVPRVSQMHVHWVGDAIQPSLPLLSPSPPAFNLSKCQGLSQWVISSHQVAKVREFQLQHQYLQWIFRTDLP